MFSKEKRRNNKSADPFHRNPRKMFLSVPRQQHGKSVSPFFKSCSVNKSGPLFKSCLVNKIGPLFKSCLVNKSGLLFKSCPVNKIGPFFKSCPVTQIGPLFKSCPENKIGPLFKNCPEHKIGPLLKSCPENKTSSRCLSREERDEKQALGTDLKKKKKKISPTWLYQSWQSLVYHERNKVQVETIIHLACIDAKRLRCLNETSDPFFDNA